MRKLPGSSLSISISRSNRQAISARFFAAKRSSCSASTPTPILSAVLPIASARLDRAADQGSDFADRRDFDQRTTERANADAQQLRLAAEALQPA